MTYYPYVDEITERFTLPRTEEQFTSLIDRLTAEYDLPNREHATAVVANRIMHLPPDQPTTTLEYLGGCVIKNLAYQLAQNIGQKTAHKSQVDELISKLTANPNDNQARDALTTAATQGSEYAKTELEKLDLPHLTLVSDQRVSTEPA